MRIVESWLMVDQVEDWSRVRSPSRARRRRKQGHPQRVFMRQVPKREAIVAGDTAYMHPEMAREFRRLTEELTK